MPKYRFLDDSKTFSGEHFLDDLDKNNDNDELEGDSGDRVGDAAPALMAKKYSEIILLDVKESDFKAFLKALYPKNVSMEGATAT